MLFSNCSSDEGDTKRGIHSGIYIDLLHKECLFTNVLGGYVQLCMVNLQPCVNSVARYGLYLGFIRIFGHCVHSQP